MPDVADIILDLSTVDFTNVDEINSFAIRLINAGNSIDLFINSKPHQSRKAIAIYQAAKGWVNTVKRLLPTMRPSDSLKLVDSYDIIHRIGYQTPANSETITNIKLAAFEAMIRGDETIDEYTMFHVIRQAIYLRNKAFFDRPMTWTCICVERWHKEAVNGFDYTKLTDYDILSRINILLESDLFAYEGSKQDRFKQYLVLQNLHYLNGYKAQDKRTSAALERFCLLADGYTNTVKV